MFAGELFSVGSGTFHVGFVAFGPAAVSDEYPIVGH